MKKIRDCANTLRSKNCDPFYTTFDIFFDEEFDCRCFKFQKLRKHGVAKDSLEIGQSTRTRDLCGQIHETP